MDTNEHLEQSDETRQNSQAPNQEARLPQIDPITFSALTLLDGFVSRAALTRQEHAEANRSLQHLVQTIEMLQSTVKELAKQCETLRKGLEPSTRLQSPITATTSNDELTVQATVAEEMFRNSRKK